MLENKSLLLFDNLCPQFAEGISNLCKKNLKTGETEEKKKEIKKEIIPGYGLLLIGTKIILLTLKTSVSGI